MPEDTNTDSKTARLLPVLMPGPIAPALGEWHGRGCASARTRTSSSRPMAVRGQRPG
jgi:hypothetical protein